VPKFYWTVMSRSTYAAAAAELRPADLLPHWTPALDELEFAYPDDRITALVAAGDSVAAKVAALAAHATQVVVGPTSRACALSNDLALPISGDEHYILVSGTPGELDDRGWEHDLLSGLPYE
jgi:N-acetyl-1-D-myo-inositol-2-amino-2-deoxy-alpha-D-glucopyranoside deacetylase